MTINNTFQRKCIKKNTTFTCHLTITLRRHPDSRATSTRVCSSRNKKTSLGFSSIPLFILATQLQSLIFASSSRSESLWESILRLRRYRGSSRTMQQQSLLRMCCSLARSCLDVGSKEGGEGEERGEGVARRSRRRRRDAKRGLSLSIGRRHTGGADGGREACPPDSFLRLSSSTLVPKPTSQVGQLTRSCN